MDANERELVRQTLAIIDGDTTRASNRIRDAMQIIRAGPMPFNDRRAAIKKLEEANEILFAISKSKVELYNLMNEQAKDKGEIEPP